MQTNIVTNDNTVSAEVPAGTLTIKQMIEKEVAESLLWSDEITSLHDVVMDCEDRFVHSINQRGNEVTTRTNTDTVMVAGRPMQFTYAARKQLFSKLGINYTTFNKLTAPVRKQVVEDMRSQIGDNDTIRLRIRDDKKGAVAVGGVVSKGYEVIEHHDILENVLPLVESGVLELKSGNKAHWRNPFATRHYRLVVPESAQDIGRRLNGDIVASGVHIRNSNLGGSAFAIDPIIWREVCDNSIVTMGEFFRQNHTNVDAFNLMDKFRGGLDESVKYAYELIGKFDSTHDHFLGVTSMNEFKKMFKRLAAKTGKDVSQMALASYKSTGGTSLYDLLNGFTWAAQKLYDVNSPSKRIAVEGMIGQYIEEM